MNYQNIKLLLKEIKDTAILINENIDNKNGVKFLSGKLCLLIDTLIEKCNNN